MIEALGREGIAEYAAVVPVGVRAFIDQRRLDGDIQFIAHLSGRRAERRDRMAGKGGGESIWISENRDDVVIVHDHPAIGLRAIENGFFFSRPFEKGVGVDQIILGKGIEFGAQSAHRAAALFRPEMGIRFARIRLEHT